MKRLVSSFAALGAVLLMALPAQADGAGAVSSTQTFHSATATIDSGNPCSGVPGTLTLVYNGVLHSTLFTSGVRAGTGGARLTVTGTFTLVQIDGVTFTGQLTNSIGDIANLNAIANTQILVINGTGSDGSTLTFHDVAHFTVVGLDTNSPSLIVEFDKPTCG
jgi:hypothetical protein